jgi:hypothetical protein
VSTFLSPEEIGRRCNSLQCELIGTYTKSIDLANFRCLLCGDQFASSFNKLSTHRTEGQPGCSKCFTARNRRFELERYLDTLRSYAESRGGRLITTQITSAKNRVTFQCAQKHEWSSVAEATKNQHTWCPNCAGVTPRTLKQLRIIVESRGGRLISSTYVNVDTKYDYECVLGHRFSNSFKKVEAGQWCPTCNKGRISEEVTRTTFEQLFEAPFQKVRPQWLRNSRGRLMELDGANLQLRLAFEYQGQQHFRKNLFIKDDEKLAQRMADDKTKELLCAENGITLVILTHEMMYKDFPLEIRRQLIIAGYPLGPLNFAKPIDLSKAYVRNDRLRELRSLLAPKNIEVLSTAWLGSDSSYEFKCHTCGHTWSALGNMFFNSRRVSGCDKCGRKRAGEAQKLNIEVLREFAARFGGEILSTEYVQRRHQYNWRCAVGHEFEGNFNNMAHRNQFCSLCEGRTLRPRKSGKHTSA